MHEFIYNIERFDKSFQMVNNQVSGHCFKHLKEIIKNQLDKLVEAS